MQTIVDTYIREYSIEKIDQDINKAYRQTEDTCKIFKKYFPDEIDKIDNFMSDIKEQILRIRDFDNAKFEYVDCGVTKDNKVWIQNKEDARYTYIKEFNKMRDAFKFIYYFVDDQHKNRDIIKSEDWYLTLKIPTIDIDNDEIPF